MTVLSVPEFIRTNSDRAVLRVGQDNFNSIFDALREEIQGAISDAPYPDQSVGTNDEGERLYDERFLRLALVVAAADKVESITGSQTLGQLVCDRSMTPELEDYLDQLGAQIQEAS